MFIMNTGICTYETPVDQRQGLKYKPRPV